MFPYFLATSSRTKAQEGGSGNRVCCTTSLKEEYFLEQLALNY